MRKIIYTTIVGKGYKLRNPEKVCPDWDYICYTDQGIESDIWKIENIPPDIPLNNRQASRVNKIMTDFVNLESISIYIDSKFRPINNLDGFVKYYLGDNDIALLEHNNRKCLYKEAKYISAKNIDLWENMRQQINKYLDEGLPKDYGLWAPGIMVRRNSKVMQAFNKLWWREYCEGSERDMLSLAYSIWRSPQLKIGIMPFRATYKRWRK